MRPASEFGRRVGRAVHLDEGDVHEERLVALRMLFDVVDRGVDGDTERGGSLDAGLETKIRIACLEIEARPVQARESKRGAGIEPGRGETGQGRVPVM